MARTADRVKETNSATGTSAFTLTGADGNHQAFADAFSDQDVVFYAAVNDTDSEWEVGEGTLTVQSGDDSLSRDTVLDSSNLDSTGTPQKVSFTSAPKVFATLSGAGSASLGLGHIPARDIGQTSSNVTLDLSQNSVFELEPTADITIDITGLASSGSRAACFLRLNGGGDHTLTFSVNGVTGDFVWHQEAAPTLTASKFFLDGGITHNTTEDISANQSLTEQHAFKSDGTKIYITDASNKDVTQYSAGSGGWNVNGMSKDSSLDISTDLSGSPRGIDFKSDGTKMYIADTGDNSIKQYTLSTAWDVTSASLDKSADVGGSPNTIQGIFLGDSGTKMFVADLNSVIHEETLSTAYDIASMSHTQNFDVSGEFSDSARGIWWKDDGSKFFVAGVNSSSGKVASYIPSNSWTLDTPTLDKTESVNNETSQPNGLSFKPDGTKMFISHSKNGEFMEQYDTNANLTPVDILQIIQSGSGKVAVRRIYEDVQ